MGVIEDNTEAIPLFLTSFYVFFDKRPLVNNLFHAL